MPKQYIDKDVYTATLERLRIIFENFPKVYVAFSGGKDSSIMMHLAIEVAREMNKLPVHSMFVDLEGNYDTTLDHVKEIFDMPEVKGY